MNILSDDVNSQKYLELGRRENRPHVPCGVFVVDIPNTANTTNKKIAAVTIILLHELAHYFGLDEQYNKLDFAHDGPAGYQCVMEEFHADDYENFYEDIINNRAYAFCTSCQNQLEVLLGSF